jgi:CubicO group peptidase (beta-lactamase class C family)
MTNVLALSNRTVAERLHLVHKLGINLVQATRILGIISVSISLFYSGLCKGYIVASGEKIARANSSVDLNTSFFIGSVSKQITAVLALKYLPAVLDTNVTKILTSPWYSFLRGVTVRQLLHHMSGIDFKTFEKHAEYKYQNENYDIVGKVLEAITGRAFTDLAHDPFIAAERNTFLQSDVPTGELFTKLKKSLQVVGLDHTKLTNILNKDMNPSSGVVSTAADLLKWSKYLEKEGLYAKLADGNIALDTKAGLWLWYNYL